MPFVEFKCENCAAAPAGRTGSVIWPVRVKKIPPIGARRKCVHPGCKNKMVRIISLPAMRVEKSAPDLKPDECLRTCINGQEMAFQFVDHPHTDPQLQRNLAALGHKHGLTQNGLGNARFDPKRGKMVVDVVSNQRDPLGTIERAKRSGQMVTTTKKVGQKYKLRGK